MGPTEADAAVFGRELELSDLLKFIRCQHIENVVFISADVHFAAALSHDPAGATFKGFEPFWEFVIGPVQADAFGANDLDTGFGPRFEYLRAPSAEGFATQNLPPPRLQSFVPVEVTEDGRLLVRTHDPTGAVLFEEVLEPGKFAAQSPRRSGPAERLRLGCLLPPWRDACEAWQGESRPSMRARKLLPLA